jgi:succinate dehydrogenase/fumarate reductase-like Fe-S protein
MIPIYIMGKKYEVPKGLTIMKALEYSGYQLTRGCGCRGGVCGACATIYRKEDDYKWQIGLACQTVAEENIFLVQLPYVPAHKAHYNIQTLEPSEENVVSLYPELMRCMGCNTCTRSCPMELEVMNYVSAAITGDWETVQKLSMDCIMCGMCAARCPGELAPFNIAMLVRRIVGKSTHKTPESVVKRLQDIRGGVYKAELAKLKTMSREELLGLYREFQATKGAAV